MHRENEHRTAQAKLDLEWLFRYALGDAANARASHYRELNAYLERAAEMADYPWSVAELAAVFATHGSEAGSYASDEASRVARQRLRKVHAAFRRLSPRHQSVLEAFFDDDRPSRSAFCDVGPGYMAIVAMFSDVVAQARREGITRMRAARRYVEEVGADQVNADAREVLTDALDAYVDARWPSGEIRQAAE